MNYLNHTTITFLPVFRDRPSSPPSRAQEVLWNQRGEGGTNNEGGGSSNENSGSAFLASIRRLLTNPGYVLLLITYGLNVGVFYAISTLLNTVVLNHFEVGVEDKNYAMGPWLN